MAFENLLHFNPGSASKVIGCVENWPVYALDYLGLAGNRRLRLRLRNGLCAEIRPGGPDRAVLDEVFANNAYLPEGMSIGEGDIVVDVGAHIGMFSLLAAKHAHRGRVYSFEPAPDNFGLLIENIRLNGFRNIRAENSAVSGKCGPIRFFHDREGTATHSIFRMRSGMDALSVPSITLERFMRNEGLKRIDFLKLDCEGAEYDILFRCPKKTLRSVRAISMECHPVEGHSAGRLESLLMGAGFSIRRHIPVNSMGNYMLYASRAD